MLKLVGPSFLLEGPVFGGGRVLGFRFFGPVCCVGGRWGGRLLTWVVHMQTGL